MSVARELDQYVAELRTYENAIRRTQGYSSNAYGVMERTPDGGAAFSYGEFVEGVFRVFGPAVAQAVKVAADPYEAAIHNLASDLNRSQTAALMWEDFARWRDARAVAFQAIFADARREAEAGNAHLRDVIGGALHGRKTRQQIVDLLAPLVAEDEEPF